MMMPFFCEYPVYAGIKEYVSHASL
jgi:hypothetical protein